MPRKTIQQRSQNRSRISPIVKKLIGTEKADDIMIELMSVLVETRQPPVPGKYYIFVYNAKTPNIQYDQNPFVYVKNVYGWGFSGLNYHWKEDRQYTWGEVAGGMYEVYKNEIDDLLRLPFMNVRNK